MKNKAGFTLIEVLVVMFIFVIIFTMISLNLGGGLGDKRKLGNTAQGIMTLIQVAQQEASSKAVLYRFVVESGGYGIQKWSVPDAEKTSNQSSTENPSWHWDKKDKLLRFYPLDKNIKMVLDGPVNLYPSGDISPFEMHLKLESKNDQMLEVVIIGEANGSVRLDEPI